MPLEGSESPEQLPQEFPETLKGRPFVTGHCLPATTPKPMLTAIKIVEALQMKWDAIDGLPINPHLFSYEKDIIAFFFKKKQLGEELFNKSNVPAETWERLIMTEKLRHGCPAEWPSLVDLSGDFPAQRNLLKEEDIGAFRPRDAYVSAQSLGSLEADKLEFGFREAGPRKNLMFPVRRRTLNVGIVVSGGIAPGINAVIDGIVQRHWKYAGLDETQRHILRIRGFRDGFYAFKRTGPPGDSSLIPDDSYRRGEYPQPTLATSDHATSGGSIVGTYRLDDLIKQETRGEELAHINSRLRDMGIDILYVIGGDGSMKAAHALWNVASEDPQRTRRPLSVVAIPKTMDNDILWVWQSFGFLSAVEKARETIELIHTEVKSNPRLCVLQMFGSDSGFVVSHAVLASAAGHCDLALIPEVPFSMIGIASYLKDKIAKHERRIPYGLVVMAETAIPVDVACFVKDPKNPPSERLDMSRLTDRQKELIEDFRPEELGLERNERRAIREYDRRRWLGLRIEGQTSDSLRRAGLKVVQRCLQYLLGGLESRIPFEPNWDLLRSLSNEPRHLLRAIPPSTTDIIMGQRLGVLAVDNAMAGYTNFMISQWLTEFVLVPLELVVLGRKRIPDSGIFWKSVLAKTSQPSDLVRPWVIEST